MPGDAAVTIGSLNLHCGLTGRGRPFDVAAAIARLPADIIALQETWRPHPAADVTARTEGADRIDGASAAGSVQPARGAKVADASRTADGNRIADGNRAADELPVADGMPAADCSRATGGNQAADASRAADELPVADGMPAADGVPAAGCSRATGGNRAAESMAADGRRHADGVEEAARELGARLIRATVRDGATLADLRIAPSPERGTWGIAVLSRLPVISHETIDLGRAPGDVASRVALICVVTTPGGWPLRLVNAHLTHRFTSPVQLARLAGHLARSRVPTMIAGDLNMPRPATWVAAYAGSAPTVRGATFPAHRPIIQLDHLLAGSGLAYSGATVLPTAGSDHLPVLASFRLRRPVRRPARRQPSPRRGSASDPRSPADLLDV